MEVTIRFNLPEERDEHETFIKAGEYKDALREIDNHLRSLIKHGHDYDSVESLAEDLCREFIPDLYT